MHKTDSLHKEKKTNQKKIEVLLKENIPMSS